MGIYSATTSQKRNIAGMSAAFCANIIFGFTFVFTKQILNAGMAPFALLSWRMLIATLVMAALSAFGVFKLRFRGKKLWRLIPVGLASPCLYFVCETYGISNTTASESGTIIAFIPILVLIFSRLVFKEHHTPGQLVGVPLSVAGIILVVLAGGFSANFSQRGYLLLFGAVVLAALYNIGVRWLSDEYNSAEITFSINLLGLIFFTALAIGQGLMNDNLKEMLLLPLQNPNVLINVLLLAISASLGAYMLVVYAIGSIGPTRSSSFAGITTMTSIIFGLVLLDEHMLPLQFAGAALIIVGVWSTNHFVRFSGGGKD